MKTKTTLLALALLFVFCETTAQYFVDSSAPANTVSLAYHKDHFNLKGPVKSYNNNYTTYYFDRDGYLTKDVGSLGLSREYLYDSNNNLIRIVSDLSGSLIHYSVTLDSQKRVTKKITSANSGKRYTYDRRGNVLEEYDTYNKELQYRNKYDSQGRIIQRNGYYNAINETSLTTYSYGRDGDFVTVTNNYSSSNPKRKSSVNTFYYKNGHYYGKSKYSDLSFDSYGNPQQYANADGSAGTKKTYTYWGEGSSNNSTVSTPSSPNSVPKPNTSTSTNNDCVSGDCQNGWGKKNFEYGYYEGFWKNGVRHGYGLFDWDTSGKYIGFWVNDKLSGYGCYLGTEKNLIGEYRDGSMNGVGYTHELKNDKWVRGEFRNYLVSEEYDFYDNKINSGCIAGDCQNKYGRYKWSNGDMFTGFFRNGKMYMGTYSFASGDKYEGMFNSSNQFHGEGRFFFKDGAYYGGQWN
ncbi:MAG: hypothetical protein HKN48_01090, partial [Flavobacteriaceae bacterium]|nr:hypothetical protein [Flavobacteriaceae bacterium]